MDKSKQGKLPASPMGDFGPPGSGRPQPLGSLHRRNESVTTDSSYSYAGLLQNSSPLLPDTPTRPPRYPSSNDGNSLQTTALESSLGGQLNLQISRQQNLVS